MPLWIKLAGLMRHYKASKVGDLPIEQERHGIRVKHRPALIERGAVLRIAESKLVDGLSQPNCTKPWSPDGTMIGGYAAAEPDGP